MTRAYQVRLGRWQWVAALLVIAAFPGSAQDPKKSVSSEPKQNAAGTVSDQLTARQQWTILQQAKQLSRRAESLEKQGKGAEAEKMAERALASREQVLGPEDLEVARSLDQVADLYTAHKKESAAEPLYQRAQAIRDLVLSTHPDVYDRDGRDLKIHRSQPAEKTGAVEPPH